MIVPAPIVVDFEFEAKPGNVPRPHTMCARELATGSPTYMKGSG